MSKVLAELVGTLRASRKLTSDQVLKKISRIEFVVQKFGPGQSGIRKLIQQHAFGLKYQNPNLQISVKTTRQHDAPSSVQLFTATGQEGFEASEMTSAQIWRKIKEIDGAQSQSKQA
eukprot:TRINITY_DN1251_c0_g1_i1.p2 TRINITY_DN1251_c0_g1~~TRINITY_DN1251_c0_g1_i1.p2  ORF type:complete len:117 (+),score=24.20 TRINITY_DN1251_c0_g1_i1:77-427(+)